MNSKIVVVRTVFHVM
jgi:hypothetical protein